MANRLVWILLLCACRDSDRPAARPAVEAPAHDAQKPRIDVASIVPKQPGVFGPWAKFPFGTTFEEFKKSAPELLEYSSGTPRFDGGFEAGQLAVYRIELDDKDAAAVEAVWGPPKTIIDARGKPHTLWATSDLHIERTGTTLRITSFVPLASYLGKKGFAFEAERSLVGLPAKDAIAQIRKWTDAKQLAMSVEGDIDSTAAAIGTTADRVVVVGEDGSTTPLSKMPVRSIDVSLPPTEGNFEATEYNFTRLRIWLDDQGVVKYYWFDVWVDPAGHAAATALLAKTYGKPSTSGESLRYPVKPVVCFPREPRPYATISVGDCK